LATPGLQFLVALVAGWVAESVSRHRSVPSMAAFGICVEIDERS